MAEIAASAGASSRDVALVMAEDPRVSPELRQRIPSEPSSFRVSWNGRASSSHAAADQVSEPPGYKPPAWKALASAAASVRQ